MEKRSHFFGRIKKRLREDIAIIRIVKNWRSFLLAKIRRQRLHVIRLRNGIVLNGPPEVDLNFLFHEIWLEKVYNPPGYEIGENDTVIDIGGNIGMFAIYAATHGSAVRVFAFEPFPKNASFFSANARHAKLSGIMLYEKAVAGAEEKRFLQVSDVWISHSLTEKGTGNGTMEVDCTTLDSVIAETGTCDLLKTDCEGSEYEIFYAASKESLSRIHRVVGEYHRSGGHSGEELMSFLRDHSFRIDVFRELDDNIGMFCATNINFKRTV